MDAKNPGVSDPVMLILDPGVSQLLLRRATPQVCRRTAAFMIHARQRHHSRRRPQPVQDTAGRLRRTKKPERHKGIAACPCLDLERVNDYLAFQPAIY